MIDSALTKRPSDAALTQRHERPSTSDQRSGRLEAGENNYG